jgi:hypothetical protein
MHALTFDTLKFARRLKEAGMDPHLAEEQAEALAEVLAAKFDTLVEKRDLAELRQELLREIASLRQENAALRKDMEASDAALRQEMENGFAALRKEMENEFAAVRKEMQLLEQRLIIKLGAMLVVATGVLATLMKLL